MPNRLAHEKSPYLLQHANNPVAWFPWGEEAFAKARTEQKPIFLSIGYSTCHWCHVMEHESFENPDTAKILNEHFVSIKVDREERPDVDRVYMAYVQALTGHGGWPLNAWLTPELKPFYAGTYFPPEERHGRASFPNILRAIARGWQQERDRLVAESERVIETLRGHHAMSEAPAGGMTLEDAGAQAYEQCFEYLHGTFDAQHSGFGSAPKFPRAANLNFLFRVAAIQSADSEAGREALRLATATLQAMARGGIHDHVGGGFHRYAVDGAWFVPHFEKMLYDQAQIAINCLDAKQATGDERFAWLARDIFSYVQRDLTSRAGGFFTAEDADSKVAHESHAHSEGAFYVWTKEELALVLNDGLATDFFCSHFGVADKGNVPPSLDPQGELEGQNVLAQQRPLADTAEKFSLSPEAANDRLIASLARLREVRSRRPRPSLDDKIVTANNGLMISAFARGAAVLGEGNYLVAARNAAEFVRRELFDAKRGVLFRSWRETRGSTEGFAEDYAFFIQALLDLYEASFEIGWLQWAERLQETMDALFRDEARGGYFNSAAGDATIVLRLQDDYDGAEPAASSVAAMNLFRLGAMLHDEKWTERGRRCVDAFRSRWLGAPHAMPQMLCALELALEVPRHVVIAGDPSTPDFRALASVLHETPGRRRTLLAADGGEAQQWLASRAPWLAEMKPIAGRAAAYVCEEYACQAPVMDPAELRARVAS